MKENYINNIEDIWTNALSQIKDTLPQGDYDRWFSHMSFGGEKDGKITLIVPSQFVKDKLADSYLGIIENTLSEFAGRNCPVVFEIDKSKRSASFSHANASESPSEPVKKERKNHPLLNPAYTFDSFVMGGNSNFAYSSALAIAKNPGSAYNPCLIYGGVGLGKTHLLQSIGNYVYKNTDLSEEKIMYVTAENFMNEFMDALKDGKTRQFKNKYRNVSILLIDDIQILQKSEATQNELFSTFNDLYETGRQLVFTCDRPAEELKNISERLMSRFTRGLNADIQPPDYETRVAIIKSKCNERKFEMNPEVVDFIATNVSNNVRTLESCITKLIAYSELLHREISLDIAKEQLKQLVSTCNDSSGITINMIIETVASYYNIQAQELKGKSKNQSVILPRQIAMYLCRNLTDFSTTEIGMEFGGKEHTTVMYNVKKIEAMMKATDSDIPNVISKLSNTIRLKKSGH